MVRTSGIASGGTNAAITFVDQVIQGQPFVAPIAPILPGPAVQKLGEGLRQAIRQGLGHDGIIIIVVALESRANLFQAKTRADRECPQVIRALALGRDIVRQAVIELVGWFAHLLPQEMERGQDTAAGLVGVEHDIIPARIGGEETVRGSRRQ